MLDTVNSTNQELGTRETTSASISIPGLTETGKAAAQFTQQVGGGRSEVRVLHNDFDALHKDALGIEWRTITADQAKADAPAMLEDLANLGFAWRDISRLLKVSVPAIQKWRRGGGVSGDNRKRIAGLLAACELIKAHYMVDDIASWFEMPLSTVPITPIDLYANERPDLVFEYAGGQVDPEALLTEYDPEWREKYRSDFEVFKASDGNRSIRLKR
ncbi:hypothetical protein [Bifidobacterium aquikefiri]|uniref:hypothetical protein n=1 Tax=Bifidobacterium aquikefiri TaxID=1653207 RepID=UPI0023F4FD26|nr:hypothetical protein [Bifidobacterium aquikefiri]